MGLSFSVEENQAFYVPIPQDPEEAQKIVNEFKSVYEDERILKIGQNIKYDLMVLQNYGITLKGEIFDTMIAHYLLQPELRHGMDYLAEVYLNYQTIHIEELIGPKGKNQKNMADLPPSQVYEYACEDADITLKLKNVFEPKLKEEGCYDLFREVEMPLMPVLAWMERNGVCIDTEALKETSTLYTKEMNRLEGVLGFSGMMNGKELALLYTDSHTFNVVYDGQETSTSFMPTATGIQFYLPVEVGGKELHRFTWSAANETLVAENAPDVVLKVDYDPEYIIYAQYLGKYTMNYRRGENTPVLSLEIELVKKEDMKSYTIKGMLPIDLTMIYNKAERRMELLNQKLTDGSEAYLSIWMVNPGSLTYGGTDFVNGMYGKLKEGSDNEYEFVDDGRKADFVTRGMILWSKAGEYKAYAESRFAFITLVKHE